MSTLHRAFLFFFFMTATCVLPAADSIGSLLKTDERLYASDFKNYSPDSSTIKAVDGALHITITATAEWPSVAAFPVNNLPPNQTFRFSSRVSSSQSSIAYLQVKLYKNDVEIGFSRTDSAYASRKGSLLSACFNTADADRVDLLFRIIQSDSTVGASADFRDITLTKVDSSDATQLPKIELLPGYENCGIYINNCQSASSSEFSGNVFFRKSGDGNWKKAQDLVYLPDEKAARSSLFKLMENTEYELKIELDDHGKKESLHSKFKTKSSDVPVAHTIVLGPDNFKGKLVISESGKADGYIRYTAAPGFVLEGSSDTDEVIRVDEADFIILDNLKVRGGRLYGINLLQSQNLIVRNCDIAGFGELGEKIIAKGGKYFVRGRMVNDYAGIRIKDSGNLLIERNYIHDSKGKTCPWFYSHPDGPHAVYIKSSGGTSIRYNDFIGSDEFRWNGGENNGSLQGGFYRDSEIYGNYFAFGNDDGVELDGGQMNSRYYYNKTEGMLCGVSTAPCMAGPSYIFENLFCNPGDEFQVSNIGLKNTFQRYGKGRLLFFNNTIVGDYSGYSAYYSMPVKLTHPDELKALMRNNLFYVSKLFVEKDAFRLPNDFDYDLFWCTDLSKDEQTLMKVLRENAQEKHGIFAKPEFVDGEHADFRLTAKSPGIAAGIPVAGLFENPPNIGAFQPDSPKILPYRPLALVPDKTQLNFLWTENMPLSQSLTVTCESAYSGKFVIRQNSSTEFFTVSPAEGKLEPGKTLNLTVTLNSSKIVRAKVYSGAFLITAQDGFSRPVSVRADFRNDTARVKADRKNVIYGKVSEQDSNGNSVIEFDLKAPGEYYLFAFASKKPYGIQMRKAGAADFVRNGFYGIQDAGRPTWYAMSSVLFTFVPNIPYKLEAGKHKFELKRLKDIDYKLDRVALAATPEEILYSPFVE